jgi:arabinogalactan endo-1,4-beta-galactosidase
MVQIGNETNNGLLWPEGKASVYPKQYAGLITSGYNAVKSLCSASVVVHLANGYDNSLFQWNIGILYNNAAKFDAVGMSLYPTTSNWSTLVSQCKTNIADMKSRYSKWCVLSEIGIAANSGTTGASFVKAARALCNDVYYWEPEAYNWQGYGLGAWDYSTKKPTVIITTGLKSADVTNEAFQDISIAPKVVIAPNPAIAKTIQIQLTGVSGITSVKLVNTNGQVIKQQIVKDVNIITMSVPGLASGVYFVQIDNAQIKEVETIVVE